MSNCLSTLKKAQFRVAVPSSLHTFNLQTTNFDRHYWSNGPADRNPIGKGVAVKYNSYVRYLNRIRERSLPRCPTLQFKPGSNFDCKERIA
jgi:hypothetical protein